MFNTSISQTFPFIEANPSDCLQFYVMIYLLSKERVCFRLVSLDNIVSQRYHFENILPKRCFRTPFAILIDVVFSFNELQIA